MYKNARGSTLGIMCLKIILRFDAPATFDASIKGLDFRERVCDLIIRETAGHLMIAMIKTIIHILNCPNKEASINKITRDYLSKIGSSSTFWTIHSSSTPK